MILQDKVFIVTGASRGIGRSLSLALSRAGAQVAICARGEDDLKEVAGEIEEGGGRVFARVCDIGDRAACASFVEETVGVFGGVDALINNAGALGPRRDVLDYPPDTFEQVLRVNVIGTLNFTQAALPYLLRAAPGVLINLSSGLGRFGVRQVSAYCASKFAIEGFTQSLADEHPGTELVVMAVSPGMVATDMLRAYLDTQDVDAHLNPDRVGAGFVQLLEMANPGWTGRSVDIEEFLSD